MLQSTAMFLHTRSFRGIVWSEFVWLFLSPPLIAQQTAKPFDEQFPALHREIKFQHLTPKDGLSHDNVTAILQDRRGFMWFGTEDGLNRYDGYSFKVYKHNPRDSTTIPHNNVADLYEDTRGRLWVATYGGLVIYDPVRDAFVQDSHILKSPAGSTSPVVAKTLEDPKRNLWMSTGNGLYRYNEKTDSIFKYIHDPNDSASLSSNFISSLLVDKAGKLWIGTSNRLNRYNESTNSFTRFLTDSNVTRHSEISCVFEDSHQNLWVSKIENGFWRFDSSRTDPIFYPAEAHSRYGLPYAYILSINEDRSGRVWLGTQGGGLVIFDSKTKTCTIHRHDASKPYSLFSDRVRPIYRDRTGAMWVATYHGGINQHDPNRETFLSIQNIPNNENSLSSNVVSSVLEDRFGEIWVGTNGGGLNRFNRNTNTWRHYLYNSMDPHSISSDNVFALCEDREGNIWVGNFEPSAKSGLDRFARTTNRFVHYPVRFVKSIFEDRDGELWVGRLHEYKERGEDIIRLDQKRNVVARYTIHGNGVWTFYQDRAGDIWCGGMYCCLNRFDKKTNSFLDVEATPSDSNRLGSGAVRTIYEDKDGFIWFGTWGGGLNRYDPRKDTFKRFDDLDGLPSDWVKGMLPDEHGNLWISTEKGLTRFDLHKKTFKNFTTDDGLLSMFFNTSCFKGKSGWMYFGSDSGLIVFHPDSVRDNPNVPLIWISSFKVFEKDFSLPQSITSTEKIELSYDENFFSFESVALDYVFPEKNQYAHKLEGIDEDWVHDGTRRYASYTSVPPGEYVLRIKGSNSDGVWNEKGTSIKIIIAPPWWRTTWAYLGYALIAGFVFYSARRYDLNRVRIKHELELEHVASEKLREVDQMKSRFFANISHEFRTPLTLILGPIQKWRRSLNPEERSDEGSGSQMTDEILRLRSATAQDVEMMERNAQRLLRLINQLLDLSKLEAGGMKLQASPGNIVPFVKGIAQSFESSAGRRGIALNIEAENENIEAYFE